MVRIYSPSEDAEDEAIAKWEAERAAERKVLEEQAVEVERERRKTLADAESADSGCSSQQGGGKAPRETSLPATPQSVRRKAPGKTSRAMSA